MASALERYLQRYLHPEVLEEPRSVKKAQVHLTLPCFDEGPKDVEQLLLSLPRHISFIVSIVVNESTEASTPAKQQNQVLLNFLDRHHRDFSPHHIEVFNYTQEKAFGPRSGVGLARKIGLDRGLWLWHQGLVASPILHTTDADATLPKDYGQRPTGDASAWIYPFVHRCDVPEHQAAVQAYDLKLRCYEAGLRYAKSPYAFQTVGSTLAIDAQHYAKVRGMPDRLAGEDFYILNKLNKCLPVQSMEGEPILLSGRLSQRTPFGTGVGIQKILAQESVVLSYPPFAYHALGIVLSHLERGESPRHAKLPDGRSAELFWEQSKLWRAEAHLDQKAMPHKQRIRGWHTWFDAFITLKWVHFWQKELGSAPLIEVYEEFSEYARIPRA